MLRYRGFAPKDPLFHVATGYIFFGIGGIPWMTWLFPVHPSNNFQLELFFHLLLCLM